MRIRRSGSGDGARVLAIWHAAVLATHDFLASDDLAAIASEVQTFLPAAPLDLIVDDADHPLGFMLLDGDHMAALFVDPAWHGRGVGRMLVEHACSIHPVLTTDVNEQNVAACGFYASLGFTATGRSAIDDAGRHYPLVHLRRG